MSGDGLTPVMGDDDREAIAVPIRSYQTRKHENGGARVRESHFLMGLRTQQRDTVLQAALRHLIFQYLA